MKKKCNVQSGIYSITKYTVGGAFSRTKISLCSIVLSCKRAKVSISPNVTLTCALIISHFVLVVAQHAQWQHLAPVLFPPTTSVHFNTQLTRNHEQNTSQEKVLHACGLKDHVQFFRFSQLVPLCFIARENHLKFRAQLEHLCKTERACQKQSPFSVLYFSCTCTSSFPALSNTSEFSASTTWIKTNT